jgi:F-type H+-transporting ATPase subunit epsilon
MTIPKNLRLEFVTPERAIAHEEVDEVQLPGEEGSFGVLPGHAPLLAALAPGEMWFRKGANKQFAFVGGGLAEVLPDRVIVLAAVAERAEEIDEQRAEAAMRRAQQRLSQGGLSAVEFERARIAMLRALQRMQVSRQTRTRG